jgi:hypothetical protein
MIKTRKEILEVDHDSALSQLIENEINLENLENKVILTLPGVEYDEINKKIEVIKANKEQINKILLIIEAKITKEIETCKNMN